jgi:hypothetical protein
LKAADIQRREKFFSPVFSRRKAVLKSKKTGVRPIAPIPEQVAETIEKYTIAKENPSLCSTTCRTRISSEGSKLSADAEKEIEKCPGRYYDEQSNAYETFPVDTDTQFDYY